MRTRFKIGLALLALALLAIAAIVELHRQSADFRIPFSDVQIHRTGKNGKEMPANTDVGFAFEVESPTVFRTHEHGGRERFRLLGVKESNDVERRQKAIDFATEWLNDASKNVAWFSNWSNALQDEDGTWVVWARARRNGKLRCLNSDLVQAGLADVDYSKFRDYEFREPHYGGFGQFVKWRDELDRSYSVSRSSGSE